MAKKIYIDNKPITTDSKNTTLKQFYDYIKVEILPKLSDNDAYSVKAQMKNKSESIYLYERNSDMRAYLKHLYELK
jgi:hypothetical protein